MPRLLPRGSETCWPNLGLFLNSSDQSDFSEFLGCTSQYHRAEVCRPAPAPNLGFPPAAIGSGGPYALAAANALVDLPDWDAARIGDLFPPPPGPPHRCIGLGHHFLTVIPGTERFLTRRK